MIIFGSAPGNKITIDGDVMTGIESVSWSYKNQNERLWEIGSSVPYTTFKKAPQVTVNLTFWAGNGPAINLLTDNNPCNQTYGTGGNHIVVFASTCDGTGAGVDIQDMRLTSYGFQIDRQGRGKVTYAFMGFQEDTGFLLPSHLVIGLVEGNYTGLSDPAQAGIVFSQIDGTSNEGSIQAGPGSVGEAGDSWFGLVESVDGSLAVGDPLLLTSGTSKAAKADVSVAWQTLYLNSVT